MDNNLNNNEGEAEGISTTSRTGMSFAVKMRLTKRLDSLIKRLVDYQVLKGRHAQITEHEIVNLCTLSIDSFSDAQVCLEIPLHPKKPLHILGDIYGQYGDLLRIFDVLGHPPHSRYLFLGNYVDRGPQSIEVISLLLSYKVKYPKHVFLLRGNHESKSVTQHYGFFDDCVSRFSSFLWQSVTNVFTYMPIAALVEKNVFCVHSGLSPSLLLSKLKSQEDMIEFLAKTLARPANTADNVLLDHILWSDPDAEVECWDQNVTGRGYLFGAQVIDDFCRLFNIKQIIRSNEVIEKGYEFFKDNRLITIFSAPNFAGRLRNNGAIVAMKKNKNGTEIKCKIYTIRPIWRLRNKATGRMNIAIEVHSASGVTNLADKRISLNSEAGDTFMHAISSD